MLRLVATVHAQQRHQMETAKGILAGARRHGVEVAVVAPGAGRPARADAYLCWGWKKAAPLRRLTGRPVLVMERGYVGDRFLWTSLGWNGLNGRADFANAAKGPERFVKNFPGALRADWQRRDGYGLILGQVRGDAALEGCAFEHWAIMAAAACSKWGLEPRWRPHPVSVKNGHNPRPPPGVKTIGGDLASALAGAALALTWNSNSGVDAALAGVPVVACDRGAMAWPVAAHGLAADPFALSAGPAQRLAWAGRLAWCQWLPEEIARGEAWDHIGRILLDGADQADAARA